MSVPLNRSASRLHMSSHQVTPLPSITQLASNGWHDYRALYVRLDKRFSSNWQAKLAYTLGKVTDNKSDATAVVPFSSGDDSKHGPEVAADCLRHLRRYLETQFDRNRN